MLRDVLLDEPLLKFLSHREVPREAEEYARVLRASKFLTLAESGKLFVTGLPEGPPREVPLLKNRSKIVQ